MASTELIASGTTLANSADFTVTGALARTLTVIWTALSADIKYYVQHKNSDGSYQTVAVLTADNSPMVIDGSGVFRAQRKAGANASSLDID